MSTLDELIKELRLLAKLEPDSEATIALVGVYIGFIADVAVRSGKEEAVRLLLDEAFGMARRTHQTLAAARCES